MKTITLILLLVPFVAKCQNSIEGIVRDYNTLGPIHYATVALMQKDKILKGVETDSLGNFKIGNVLPGKYKIETSFVGYRPNHTNCIIHEGENKNLEINIKEDPSSGELTCFPDYGAFIIDFSSTSTSSTFITEDIKKMPIPK